MKTIYSFLLLVLAFFPLLAQTNYVVNSPNSTTGNYNTAVGPFAGASIAAGMTGNTFYGYGTGRMDFGQDSNNSFFGFNAGANNTTNGNTFIGSEAGFKNTYGTSNSFVGNRAGYSNITGIMNSAFGHQAGYTNDNGSYNSFFGYQAGYSNMQGNQNIFLGYQAGYKNINSNNNMYMGYQAGYNNTTGSDNNFIGNGAGYSNASGKYNVFLGNDAGRNSTGGWYNNFIGNQAGQSNTTGYRNIYLGYQAGQFSSTGSDNIYIGFRSGGINENGSYNTFLGSGTGYSSTGQYNTFMGYMAGGGGYNYGNYNVFIGNQAGISNTYGGSNLFIGSYAGQTNSVGSLNLFMGNSSGQLNTSGTGNTFMGDGSGYGNVTGSQNTYLGQYAGFYGNNTGSNNVFVGYLAGTGSNASAPAVTNSAAIGSNAIVSQSNSLILGATGANSVSVGIGNTAPQNKLEITKGVSNQSGLRFTNLTSASPATAFTQTKFLTVDVNGDVIMASTNGFGGRLAAENWSVDGDRLQNTNAGSVVIGQGSLQTPAGYKLVVEAGILTEKVKVAVKNTSEWSDYVFEAGYSLKPLAEVGQYIQAHKHLPGIPSAREMVEKGNDLHKTDAKLLEKIEELTLYILQLQKTNLAIQQQLQAMEQKHQSEIDALKQSIKK